MGLMEHPVIRVLFSNTVRNPLALLVRLVTGSHYTHVSVILEGVHHEISLFDGTILTILDDPNGGLGGNTEELRIPMVDPDWSLEFPEIVLFQKISILDSFLYHLKRLWHPKYRLTTPVVNCVTMTNIILNHNLQTNKFCGYSPDDLYVQIKQYLSSRQ